MEDISMANISNFLNNLLSRKQQPYIEPIQYDLNGNYDPQASLRLENQLKPLTMQDRLFGRTLTKDVDVLPSVNYTNQLKSQFNGISNQDITDIHQGLNNGNIAYANFIDKNNIRKPLTNEEITQAKAGGFNPGFEVTTKRYTDMRPGFFTDINAGLNENFYNDFQVNNLMPSKKGFGYRLGEGLGTLARGLSGALGDAYIAGYQGLDAAVGRQGLRNGDKLYRQRLKEMGYSDEDLSAIKGFITPDVYKNIANSYRLNNQVRWGDLAEFNPQIAEAIQNNPDLADSFAPSTIVQQILKTGLTDAQIANLLARTEKTKAETGQVGKPKVSINIKQGGTKSVIEHKSGSGENGSTGGKTVPKKNTTTYKEGQTATNPQTGERMVFRGGKWQRL